MTKKPKNDKIEVQRCGNCRAYPKGADKTCQGEFRAELDWCEKWADKTPETCGNCRWSFQSLTGRLSCTNTSSPEYNTLKIGGETCKHYERYAGAGV